MRSANRQSWHNLQPLPAQRTMLPFQRSFSEDEYARLAAGFIPVEMEDKWFIFMEHDRLYFHRSWTGYCIFELGLVQEGGSWRISDSFANRDPAQYGSSSESYDHALLNHLISALLLGGKSPLPIPSGVNAGIAAELHHQHVTGSGPRENASPGPFTLRSVLGWLWHWVKGMVGR
jgi:hypothetical protein